MDKEVLEKYKEAGKIAANALKFAESLTKEGASIFEIADKTEAKIIELGGQIAFPMNISINDIAAHYSPPDGDKTIIRPEDYVKLDVGTHVDGYIGDTAITVRPSGEDDLIRCAKNMLDTALKMFTPGSRLSDVGEAVEQIAKDAGFNSVVNLTGHSLDQYNLHAGLLVPNVKSNMQKILSEGEAYAVEPFCTTGVGKVKDSEPVLIFRWIQDRPSRSLEARKILELGRTKFNRLPFARRWLKFPQIKLDMALRQLTMTNAIYGYRILKEASGKPVAQAEHTVIVADRPIVTTKS